MVTPARAPVKPFSVDPVTPCVEIGDIGCLDDCAAGKALLSGMDRDVERQSAYADIGSGSIP